MNRPVRIICAPIKYKVEPNDKPCARTIFNEQKTRNEPIKEDTLGFTSDGWELSPETRERIYKKWCWDDTNENQANVGDVFIFWDYNNKDKPGKGGKPGSWAGGDFIFHSVEAVRPSSERLPSWSTSFEQRQRNVLELSPPRFKLTYEEMIAYRAKPNFRRTNYPKSGFEPGSDLMLIIEQNVNPA